MHLEETHWWDWACLNIIHSGWESLSRVMWWGEANVRLTLPLVLSVVSLGKSSQSIHSMRITSHDQRARISSTRAKRTATHLNGRQFRQVYSVSRRRRNHFQTQHEYKCRTHEYQTWVIWEKACLVLTCDEWEYSSTPRKRNRSCYSLSSTYQS